MSDEKDEDVEALMEQIGHPKGTLAVLAIYMLMFIAGWVGLWFFLFLSRGGTTF